MTFISYAQNYEDVTLLRALGHLENGFYIDVGAHDPVQDSVTKAFYDRGWRGINIEPVVQSYQRLLEDRPSDINLNVALSARAGVMTLHEVVGTGMSSGKAAFLDAHERIEQAVRDVQVPVITLDTVWTDCGVDVVHFLKIDVEGAEGDVLKGIDLDVRRPWVILLEATLPNSMEPCHADWEPLLTSRNYVFVYFDGLNRFYVAKEHEAALRGKLSLPPNIFDGFSRHIDAKAHQGVADLSADLLNERAQTIERKDNHAAEVAANIATIDGLRKRLEEQRFAQDCVQRELHEITRKHEAAGALARELAEQRDAAQLIVEKLGVRIEASTQEMQIAERHAESLMQDLQASRQQNDAHRKSLDATEEINTSLRGRVHELDAQVTLLSSSLADVRGDLAFERSQRQAGTRELADVYASLSWRLTTPLRTGNAQVRRFFRPLLSRALKATRRHRGLRNIVGASSFLAPPVHARLRRFAEARPLPLAPTASIAPTAGTTLTIESDVGERSLVATTVAAGGASICYYYVDHTVRCPVNTGMQRIARGLARSLLALGHVVRFVKWDPVTGRLVLVSRDEVDHLALWQGPVVNASERERYPTAMHPPVFVAEVGEQQAPCFLLVPEVPYINYHGAPLTLEIVLEAKRLRLRTMFTFYDAIPLRRPEMANIAGMHEAYMRGLLLADAVTPISQWSAMQLESYFRLYELASLSPTPSIRTVPCPAESNLAPRVLDYRVTDSHLILCVGTMETRKNQLTLVDAFDDFCNRQTGGDWQLVLIGNIHPEVQTAFVEAEKRNSSLRVLGNVSDDELKAFYDRCAFTVFPSIDEGFGLPIVESLWNGKPCICANFGAMAEIGSGGGCLMVDTRDRRALAEAIRQLALDQDLRLRLGREAIARELREASDYAESVRQVVEMAADPANRLGTIYLHVEHTSVFPYNTGIQRVVRGLAAALLRLGIDVVPVKWNSTEETMVPSTDEEIGHLSRWNGPAFAEWKRRDVPASFHASDWLLMPELTAYIGGADLKAVKRYAERAALRVAWVFYDTIPWKMRERYHPTVSRLHREYLERLNDFDLVLAISEFSRNELSQFLSAEPFPTPSLAERLVACPLPGEFVETERVVAIKDGDASITILCVGSVEPRKNQSLLLDAFRRAQSKATSNLTLRIVGGCHLPPEAEAAFRAELLATPAATWEEGADDVRLHTLFQECDFTVYPSIEEGFGLPILESLWNARPCICRSAGAMAEAAAGGGCLSVETMDVEALATAIVHLADDAALRRRLAVEATTRPFKSWIDYGREVASRLADERFVPVDRLDPARLVQLEEHRREMVNLERQPLLSICITTYNRASWLTASLRNLVRLLPSPHPDIEIVVCDNASTDATEAAMQPFLARADLRYFRNEQNVGMLGNLRVTAHHAHGRHVWILGDDDLVADGAIETVLGILRDHPALALIYLNYGHTNESDAAAAADLPAFLAKGTPIVPPGPDRFGTVRVVSTLSENFFTAIYCLIFRRDHALRAYSQDTSGRPFSSMLTSIPTTYYVLNYMMDEAACWLGSPQLVVNMNVSWMKYAPLWILERLPEMFDLAERLGADRVEIDRWRSHSMANVVIYFEEILTSDLVGNADLFDAARLVGRYKHLNAFKREVPALRSVYENAHQRKAIGAERPSHEVFAAFG